VIDKCGICGGTNDCFGCDGKIYDVVNGEVPTVFDLCGVCDGNNSCVGCDGRLMSNGETPAAYDLCGVCGGNNDCVGCDGVPVNLTLEDPKTKDRCGVCGGNNECVGCDDIPFSGSVVDGCGVCGGDNTTCCGCEIYMDPPMEPIPYSNYTYDRCGVCGGNDSCIFEAITPQEQPPLTLAGIIGIVVGSIVGVAIGILAPILYFSYQTVANGAAWFLPSDMKSMYTSVKENPHYKEKKGPAINPLSTKKRIDT